MKTALLFFLVVVATLALAQATDYNGALTVRNVPTSFAFQASCLLTAAGEVFSDAGTVIKVCLSEPQMISVCIMEIIPQVFQDVRFAFNDCLGTA